MVWDGLGYFWSRWIGKNSVLEYFWSRWIDKNIGLDVLVGGGPSAPMRGRWAGTSQKENFMICNRLETGPVRIQVNGFRGVRLVPLDREKSWFGRSGGGGRPSVPMRDVRAGTPQKPIVY